MHAVYDGGQDILTVSEAGIRLGISEQAVRQRIRRKTLTSQRLDGKVYVVLSTGYDSDASDNHADHDGVASAVHSAYQELVAQLRHENDLLREQLHVKDDQIRANQILLSQLTEQLRALPAPAQPETEQQAAELSAAADASPWQRFVSLFRL